MAIDVSQIKQIQDSIKAGLTPKNNVPLAPVGTSNVNNSGTVGVTPAPTAPLGNAATGAAAPATGYGGATYGTSGAANQAIATNQQKIATDKDFVASEIARTQQVIKEREASGLDTSAQQRYLTVNLGYNPNNSGTPAPNLAPINYNDYGATSLQNDIDAQIRAYQGQQDSAKLSAQFGVDNNNAFLKEQLASLEQQHNLNVDAAQQLQNRRGGFYSGGLDYQLGQESSAYATQQGGLSRDVASRNQQLLDQYGSTANTIAAQIQQLQSTAPQVIRDKILEYQMKTADLTGTFNGQKTMAAQNQEFNQGMDTKKFNVDTAKVYSDLSGKVLSPQSDPDGYLRQIQNGKTSSGTPLMDSLEKQKLNADTAYKNSVLSNQQTQNQIQNQLDQAKLSQNADQFWATYNQNADQFNKTLDQKTAKEHPTAESTAKYTDAMVVRDPETGVIKNQDSLRSVILNSNLDPYNTWLMYQRYNIPWGGDAPAPTGN